MKLADETPVACESLSNVTDICGVRLTDGEIGSLLPITFPVINETMPIPFTLETDRNLDDWLEYINAVYHYNITATPLSPGEELFDDITAAFTAYDPKGRIRPYESPSGSSSESDNGLDDVVQFVQCEGNYPDNNTAFVVTRQGGTIGQPLISSALVCLPPSFDPGVLTIAAGEVLGLQPLTNTSLAAAAFARANIPLGQVGIMGPGNLTEPSCVDQAMFNRAIEGPKFDMAGVSLSQEELDALIPHTWPLTDGKVVIRYIPELMDNVTDPERFPSFNMTGAVPYADVGNTTEFLEKSLNQWLQPDDYRLEKVDPSLEEERNVVQVAFCPSLDGNNVSVFDNILGFSRSHFDTYSNLSGSIICVSRTYDEDPFLAGHEIGHTLGSKHPIDIDGVEEAFNEAELDIYSGSVMQLAENATSFDRKCLYRQTFGATCDFGTLTPSPTSAPTSAPTFAPVFAEPSSTPQGEFSAACIGISIGIGATLGCALVGLALCVKKTRQSDNHDTLPSHVTRTSFAAEVTAQNSAAADTSCR